LKEIIRDISERYWFEIDEIGTDWYHVHIFVWASPKISPSKIMQTLKSITAGEKLLKDICKVSEMRLNAVSISNLNYSHYVNSGKYPAACCDWDSLLFTPKHATTTKYLQYQINSTTYYLSNV
jgi:REP element-mobilizing transposase RayT